jgi:hypothetical protein
MTSDELAKAHRLLGWAARIDTAEHLDAYLHSHPRLFIFQLSQQLRDQLREHMRDDNRWLRRRALTEQPTLPEDDPELFWDLMPDSLDQILDRIDDLRSQYERHELQFPLGNGPIEALWSRLDAGALRIEQAEAVARIDDISRSMAPTYVYALSNHTVNVTHAGHYSKALDYHRVLLSAVDSTGGLPEYAENMDIVASDWIEIVLGYLVDIPDARLLRDAVERGKRVVERTRVSDPRSWHALTLHRLGALHLEPYVRGRSPARFSMQDKIWRANFLSQRALDAAETPESEWQMPPIEQALPTAEAYLRDARSRRTGEERALSTKALVDALYWQYRLGISSDKAEIESLCNEALALGFPKHPEHVFYITLILRVITGHAPAQNPTLTLQSIKALQPELGKSRYCELLIQLGNTIQFSDVLTDIEEYVEALRASRQLFEEFAHPAHKSARRETLGRLLWRVLAPSAPAHLTDLTTSRHHLERAKSDRERAGNILRIAYSAQTLEEEVAAHELMKSVAQGSAELVELYADVIAQVKGRLSLNIGADFTNSGKFVCAAYAYAEAVENYLLAEDVLLSREALRRFSEVFLVAKDDLTDVVLQLLLSSGVRYELLCGHDAALGLKEITDLCSARIYATAQASASKLSLLVQIAKGRLFASTYAGHPRIDPAIIPSLNLLLAGIAATDEKLENLRSSPVQLTSVEIDNSETCDPPHIMDDELYQLSCPVPSELETGANLETVRANLQYRFDGEVRTLLWRTAAQGDAAVTGMTDFCASLDGETAVLDIYLGADLDARLAVYVFAYMNDGVGLSRTVHTDYPSSLLIGARRGQRVLFSALAGFVRDARRGILSEPGLGVVTPQAQTELAIWVKGFFGESFLDMLSSKGTSHLCIVPNGPLHFFPFHLLGPADTPFASRWKITYTPHVALLNRKQPSQKATQPMLAGGKSFTRSNPRGLPEMPDAVIEAEEIGSIFNSRPLIEDAFTPRALISALESSRYVHLSTHGEQNAVAPSFHRLFMSPDETGADTLRAYEIHKLDLSAVDLLTLSACETGLGRVDTGDNLGGLPASFLIAGVRTVVATLWQVMPTTSRSFFRRFYTELREGRSKLHAFHLAQAAVREEFAAYRDWGAFYMLGDWR